MDEVASLPQKPVLAVREVSCNLAHPIAIRLRKDSADLDSSSLETYYREYEIPNQARPRDHFDAEEISRCNRAPMSLQESLP